MSDDDSSKFEAVKVAASNFRERASFITSQPLFDIELSTVKRTSEDKEVVESELLNEGWEETGSLMNGKVGYYEKSGINITLIDTRRGSVVIPSGPVRGNLLGGDAVDFDLNTE